MLTLLRSLKLPVAGGDTSTGMNEEFLTRTAEDEIELRGFQAYENLPENIKNDFEFNRNLRHFGDTNVAATILSRHSELTGDRDVWLRVVRTADDSRTQDLDDVLEEFMVPEVYGDAEIMLEVSRRSERSLLRLESFSSPLLRDRPFLEALSPLALAHLPSRTLQLHPDLAETAIEFLGQIQDISKLSMNNLASHFMPALRDHRELQLKWFQVGLPFVSAQGIFPEEWKRDKAIFLLIARHGAAGKRRKSFMKAAESLRDDKAFMTLCLQVRPSFLVCASEQLKADKELVLLAFGMGSSRSVRAFVMERVQHEFVPGRRAFVRNLRAQTEVLLQEHKVFCETILRGISVDDGSNLRMLDQGAETSLKYKKLIADLLGLPWGNDLQLLRRALLNMSDEADDVKFNR